MFNYILLSFGGSYCPCHVSSVYADEAKLGNGHECYFPKLCRPNCACYGSCNYHRLGTGYGVLPCQPRTNSVSTRSILLVVVYFGRDSLPFQHCDDVEKFRSNRSLDRHCCCTTASIFICSVAQHQSFSKSIGVQFLLLYCRFLLWHGPRDHCP